MLNVPGYYCQRRTIIVDQHSHSSGDLKQVLMSIIRKRRKKFKKEAMTAIYVVQFYTILGGLEIGRSFNIELYKAQI